MYERERGKRKREKIKGRQKGTKKGRKKKVDVLFPYNLYLVPSNISRVSSVS